MKERPILFSAPMVQAILAGRKTQTRRIIKPQPKAHTFDFASLDAAYPDKPWCWLSYWLDEKGEKLSSDEAGKLHGGWPDCSAQFACPYGQPGDRLWVRETWRPYSWRPNQLTLQLAADGKIIDVELPDTNAAENWLDRICEQSSNEFSKAECDQDGDGNFSWDGESNNPIKWHPSIFMPRWASRLTLEITEVRVQRLQEISEVDAQAEGAKGGCTNCGEEPCSHDCFIHMPDYREGFANIWMGINGEQSWYANPWTWALTFKVIEETM